MGFMFWLLAWTMDWQAIECSCLLSILTTITWGRPCTVLPWGSFSWSPQRRSRAAKGTSLRGRAPTGNLRRAIIFSQFKVFSKEVRNIPDTMAKRPANRRRGSVLMLDLLAGLEVRQRAQLFWPSFKIRSTSHLFGFQLVEIQAGRLCHNPGSQVVPKHRKVAVVFLKQILPCLRWFAFASPNPLQHFFTEYSYTLTRNATYIIMMLLFSE